ncbi:Ig-like domain-containing protein [Bacillus paralicheniformis]|uniref:Ig-like domain-containing protein n=1 Tax=Bacillus paralicheniformis TaxID=1648923 RepID=UPI003B97EAF7
MNVQENSKTLNVGETYKISASVSPPEASQEVTYSSGNTAIATVNSSGLVTAKAAGTATITVASKVKPTVKKSVTINVMEPAPSGGE